VETTCIVNFRVEIFGGAPAEMLAWLRSGNMASAVVHIPVIPLILLVLVVGARHLGSG
jgi:hypothetical protein